MIKIFTLLIVPLTLHSLSAGGAYAQTVSGKTPGEITTLSSSRRKITRSQVFQVAAELKRQQQFLRDVASRYEAVSLYDFTPLLSYSYVWNALRENRTRLADPRRRLSGAQSKLIVEGYDRLESDVLLLFLDHQLGLLNDALELNELQYQEMQNTLMADLEQKRSLVSSKGIDSRSFATRLAAVSAQTEKKILSILFPEQRRMFHKQIALNRDRLVG